MTVYYQEVEKGDRDSSFWRIAHRAVQSRPINYNRPLEYTSFGGKWILKQDESASDIMNFMPLANGFEWDGAGGVVTASNKALAKLYTRLEQSEALVVAWKERQKALDLAASNMRRLVTIARAVKRRDPKIVRRVLKRNPKAKDIIKTPSGLWLEYHFAIAPTVQDIHHALGLLGHEFPVEKLVASSSASTCFLSGGGDFDWFMDYNFESYVKLTGDITGLNPNIGLVSQMGFGQPLSVAWEMTPFSWFIDYFVNVGSLVKNLEPRFPSVETSNNATTVLVKSKGKLGYRDSVPLAQVPFNVYDSFYMNRSRGWPSFQLEFNSPFDLKVQQCSYIAAVLVGLLTSMKRKS